MSLSRRQFIRSASAFTLGFAGLRVLCSCDGAPARSYGDPIADPQGILDLPAGFRYRVISRAGDAMDDGFQVPGLADGMAAFAGPDGRTILIRNHELNPDTAVRQGPFGDDNRLYSSLDPSKVYDPGAPGKGPCLGGTTTLIYDPSSEQVEQQFLSLIGTLRNCAGGPTPWRSWISCEEIVLPAGERCARDHGYCFEVPITAGPALADPVPLVAMGRFNHEAVALDPGTGIVYLTEDRDDSIFYRFIPEEKTRLDRGGRLQALVVLDRPSLDTRNWDSPTVDPGEKLAVKWIDLDEVRAPRDDLRLRGLSSGAARFARGEGIWYANRAVYFACTSGGVIKKGQIFRYTFSPAEGTAAETREPGQLELFVEPNDKHLLENCDNLTVAPWGDLVVCEDGPRHERIIGVTPSGELYVLARNHSNSEFAGVTFSPDGNTLFVNIQHDGLTIAITGPWKNLPG